MPQLKKQAQQWKIIKFVQRITGLSIYLYNFSHNAENFSFNIYDKNRTDVYFNGQSQQCHNY